MIKRLALAVALTLVSGLTPAQAKAPEASLPQITPLSIIAKSKFPPTIQTTPTVIEKKIQPIADDPYIKFKVTKYTDDLQSTGKSRGSAGSGITASGETVQAGVTVACSPEYAFGTKFYVKELDHEYTCTDRGGLVKGNHIDIYVTSSQAANKFGVQYMQVKIQP